MTRQEMFDRAFRGLASQGWRRAVNEHGACQYLTEDGRRCAWGWVDPDDTTNATGTVLTLRAAGCGLAAHLLPDDLRFARALQIAHDQAPDDELEASMRKFAEDWALTCPEV